MPPDNPFLAALLAQPDDDTFRLAMADWFIENDQPARAEFIRVQVELAAGVADPARRREREFRQRDLLIAHEAEWVKPLAEALGCRAGEWGGWVFRRGFVEYFHLPAEVILRRGARLARLTPVRELFLRPCSTAELADLGECHWVRSLTALYLEGFRMTGSAARALLWSPYLANLRRVCYSEDGMARDVREAFARRFARVVG